jgi:DNA-binding transcriptional ArsR family regulator
MRLTLDPYIVDTLMRDLLGHDRAPSAFVLYLWLWRHTHGEGKANVGASLQVMASETGLSKSSVQNALRRLRKRKLVSVRRDGPTAACRYEVHETWRTPR